MPHRKGYLPSGVVQATKEMKRTSVRRRARGIESRMQATSVQIGQFSRAQLTTQRSALGAVIKLPSRSSLVRSANWSSADISSSLGRDG